MRRHKPVNIIDPHSDGHSVIVHPCQDINLILTNPVEIFDKAAPEDKWEINVFSEYFFLYKIEDLDGKTKYKFVQYYDLTEWTDIRSIFLGEIEVSVSGKNIEDRYSLCVIAKNSIDETSHVITIINPNVNRIKLGIDQILEVVVVQDKNFDDKI